MTPAALAYDKEDEFLRAHGFQDVIDKPGSTSQPMDSELVARAIHWIKQDQSHPFFLTLWTADTHHPYLSSSVRDYHVNDAYLNRYLNGIEATDRLIAQIADALESMRLADDTLLVVTGDHGEAFGEHQETGHGFTTYDEEVHVPLLMVNARLFAQPRIVHSVGTSNRHSSNGAGSARLPATGPLAGNQSSVRSSAPARFHVRGERRLRIWSNRRRLQVHLRLRSQSGRVVQPVGRS